ncbi:hypothetical protein [Streptomyces sp. NBC_00258]|uniref:hypothetical protein n=1 Tax=Streptomyces sp. NBC_00258 TaxID=2903642 RepID=UPI002E2C4611|nr:hypothetical protein [Streptomyces sp. NBC_00258]
MTDRTLTPGPLDLAADDIRDYGYAIVQTRIERVPANYRQRTICGEPSGCPEPATLVTFALAQITDEGDGQTGFGFARDEDDQIVRFPVCDAHRCEATHRLYYALTSQLRPDGIRAFDLPGQHMQWT